MSRFPPRGGYQPGSPHLLLCQINFEPHSNLCKRSLHTTRRFEDVGDLPPRGFGTQTMAFEDVFGIVVWHARMTGCLALVGAMHGFFRSTMGILSLELL